MQLLIVIGCCVRWYIQWTTSINERCIAQTMFFLGGGGGVEFSILDNFNRAGLRIETGMVLKPALYF